MPNHFVLGIDVFLQGDKPASVVVYNAVQESVGFLGVFPAEPVQGVDQQDRIVS